MVIDDESPKDLRPNTTNIASSPFRDRVVESSDRNNIDDNVASSPLPINNDTNNTNKFTGHLAEVFDSSSPRAAKQHKGQEKLVSETDIDDGDDDDNDLIVSPVSVDDDTSSDLFFGTDRRAGDENNDPFNDNSPTKKVVHDLDLTTDNEDEYDAEFATGATSTVAKRGNSNPVLRDIGLSTSTDNDENFSKKSNKYTIDPPSSSLDGRVTKRPTETLVSEVSIELDAPSSSAPATSNAGSKRQERDEAKKQKDAEREAKRAKREAARKEKEHLKALEAANKNKASKASAVKEMVVDMDPVLYDTKLGEDIRSQLGELEVETNKMNDENSPFASAVQEPKEGGINTVTFRRKVTAEYDPEEDIYRPIELKVKEENCVIIIITGERFAEIVNEGHTVRGTHLDNINKAFQGKQVIYVIENLQAILRRSANETNREVTMRVRELMGGEEGEPPESSQGTTTARRATSNRSTGGGIKVDEQTVEEFLMDLQFTHSFKVVQTASKLETTEWIVDLVQEISSAPYKTSKLLSNEMFDVGNIASGQTIEDTSKKSLEKIKYVTPNMAWTIAKYYGNLYKFTKKVKHRGVDAVGGLRTENGNNGVMGKALAKTVTDIFLSKDPEQFLEQD